MRLWVRNDGSDLGNCGVVVFGKVIQDVEDWESLRLGFGFMFGFVG